MSQRTITLVVPAYQPGSVVVELAREVSADPDLHLIFVDDGSGTEYAPIFEELTRLPRTLVIRHAVNLGKGAALKSGFNAALTHFPEGIGVVTADADGQHHPADILALAGALRAYPSAAHLGVREFQPSVPLRNRFGNQITRRLVHLLIGRRISDTQTGLRALPRSLLPHLLRIPSAGYEFELDMLVAMKHRELEIRELPIRTIYDHPGRVSHFNPLLDSMKIYFVLLRFSAVSMLTAVLDNVVFFLAFSFFANIAASQILGRLIAVVFNYAAARNAVFLSRERHTIILPRYLFLVVASGLVSYGLIRFAHEAMGLPVLWAKLGVESALFLANFAIQRDFVFTRKRTVSDATNWDDYYRSVPFTAKLTRRYTTRVLIHALRRFAVTPIRTLAEIGGANSCFLVAVRDAIQPARMHIVDNNAFGLELLRGRVGSSQQVVLHQQDCRSMALPEPVDAVFSVGLIEHFDPDNTRAATLEHLRILKPGGLAILSFPTPTWLYRGARSFAEALGLWKFPDERPLLRDEVMGAIGENATLLWERTLWPLVFTQHMLVLRKKA